MLVNLSLPFLVSRHQCLKSERVVRQGDPLSPYLFIIALKLLIKIRNDSCIKGIEIDNAEVKVALFAVDFKTFLHDKGPLETLEHLFSTLEAF